MKIAEIFKQSNNKLITFDELCHTVDCLKKAMKANAIIGALPQLETFDPLATFRYKFPNDFMTLTEIMKVKCCFDSFLEPYLPQTPQPIVVSISGCLEEHDSIGGTHFRIFFIDLTSEQVLTGEWITSNANVAQVTSTSYNRVMVYLPATAGAATVSFIPDQLTTGNLSCTITVI